MKIVVLCYECCEELESVTTLMSTLVRDELTESDVNLFVVPCKHCKGEATDDHTKEAEQIPAIRAEESATPPHEAAPAPV